MSDTVIEDDCLLVFVLWHNNASTCGIDEKLSKMVGNSVSYSLKSSYTEIPLITVQWWRIACKWLHAFMIYNSLNK